jgi:hypothetical protein
VSGAVDDLYLEKVGFEVLTAASVETDDFLLGCKAV